MLKIVVEINKCRKIDSYSHITFEKRRRKKLQIKYENAPTFNALSHIWESGTSAHCESTLLQGPFSTAAPMCVGNTHNQLKHATANVQLRLSLSAQA